MNGGDDSPEESFPFSQENLNMRHSAPTILGLVKVPMKGNVDSSDKRGHSRTGRQRLRAGGELEESSLETLQWPESFARTSTASFRRANNNNRMSQSLKSKPSLLEATKAENRCV